jgi:L-ascorbate metabolism protein UlaG (beta-lactamase superfamily)
VSTERSERALGRGGARKSRRGLRVFAAIAALVSLALAAAVFDAWQGMGKRASGARRERMLRSEHFRDGGFVNAQSIDIDLWGSLVGMLHVSPHASPVGLVPTRRLDPRSLQTPARSGLRITWLGHSTNLIEIDGQRVLTDPSWSERSSPVSWLGPKRWFEPPIALGELPKIDAVVISHDHYDHLDHRTIIAMKDWPTIFVVPLGVGAHLAYWGVPEAKIVELDWWEQTRVGALDIVCTPARHASGRSPFDKDRTLWASYALVSAQHRVYFSGDTGMFPALREIGARLGPFDVTMIETGQYHPAWADWHIGPEQAIRAHQLLRGRVLLPVHWGKLQLAYHGWTEPVERVLAASASAHVSVVVPRPGQSVEPTLAPALERWWPTLPWQTEQQTPIVSSKLNRLGL